MAEDRELKRQRDHAYYLAHRDRIKAQTRAWALANPDRVKAYSRKSNARRAEAVAAWVAAHPERSREIRRQWAKRNADAVNAAEARRRARKVGRFVEDVDRHIVLGRAGGLCGWCGQPVDPADFHVDHIIALCFGGEHSYANTQPTHPKCNIAKRVALKERAA